MSLKDLDLKGLYDSDKDNLLNDFYIPVLSESVSYKRIAGYFCSNALAIAAKGISKFIENGGKIQLIANVYLSEKDQEAIKKAIEEKESELIEEIETLDDALKKGHLKLLAWMIKNNKLEIKIAVVPKGIEHKKKGILEDGEGNIISFSGSDNETKKGWLENDEEFHVFCSWFEEDKNRHLEPDIESFDRLWNDLANEVMVFPVSEAFKEGFLKTAPKDDEEFKVLSKEVTEELLKKNKERIGRIKKKKKTKKELRDYQKEAVDKWFQNGCKGIFEMATGTGKTFTALKATERLLKDKEDCFVIILCPKKGLVDQWDSEIKEFGFTSTLGYKNSDKWLDILNNKITYFKNGVIKNHFFISTYASWSKEHTINSIKRLKDKNILLIADEVHHAGAPITIENLLSGIKYRLGLSATPSRWFDDEGTKRLFMYFGCELESKATFEFKLDKAIERGFLTKYYYHPIIVELEDEKLDEYLELTKKISKRLAIKKNKNFSVIYEHEEDTILRNLLFKRADIIKGAKNKLIELDKKIKEIKNDLDHVLFFCADNKQADEVCKILGKYEIENQKFVDTTKDFERKKMTSSWD